VKCGTRAATESGAENSLVIMVAKRLMITSPFAGERRISDISASPLICTSSVRSRQTVFASRVRCPSRTAAQPNTSPLRISRSRPGSSASVFNVCCTAPEATIWMSSATSPWS